MHLVNRARPLAVALETTLLVHGVPRGEGPALADSLRAAVRAAGADPTFIGVHAGTPIAGLNERELAELFAAPSVPKANTSNLGILLYRKSHAATTVSTTMELAARAGVRVFATGGLGGVHKNFAAHLDISADLAALARFPVAVVTSGVKSLLDVVSTREALETLGVPVVGFRTDRFPAFYVRESDAKVDARFDDIADLARFADAELTRTGRAVVIANPVPESHAISQQQMDTWLAEAERRAAGNATARDATPVLLAELHALSNGATLRSNLALALDNASLAAKIRAAM
jgi:pseudouridylate synthase